MGTAETKIRKEIAIMKKLYHPNVVRLYEVIDDPLKTKIYMVMERLRGGEVLWTRNDRPILTVEQVRRIMRDVILGIQYLHHQGIIHRDIKPGNLLYSDDRRQVKIADFGVAHFSHALRLEAAGSDSLQNTDPILLDDTELSKRAGTPPFLAPEVVYEYAEHSTNGRPAITKAIDIWALGVTLYALLFGKLPFVPDPGKDSIYNTWYKIANCDWDVDSAAGSDRVESGGRHPPADRTDLGPVLVRLLDHFLQKDVTKRITLDEVKVSVIGLVPRMTRRLKDHRTTLGL
ncbi:kinase-like protein [Fistulina hepatica ATCC 64428]|nr:kinase-like protein [Fistulina hepatica ATCC 64428]